MDPRLDAIRSPADDERRKFCPNFLDIANPLRSRSSLRRLEIVGKIPIVCLRSFSVWYGKLANYHATVNIAATEQAQKRKVLAQ